MKFWKLALDKKLSIYLDYVFDMERIGNKENILTFEEYCKEADWDLSEEDFD